MKLTGYILFFLLTLFYLVMLGGGTYEQLNITLPVTRQMPESLAILKGDYGFNPVRFWALLRPLTIVLFLLTLILHWRTDYRNWLLIAFLVDCVITGATFIYFAPQTSLLIDAAQPEVGLTPALKQSILQWKNLNWVRLSAFYLASGFILIAWSKSGKSKSYS